MGEWRVSSRKSGSVENYYNLVGCQRSTEFLSLLMVDCVSFVSVSLCPDIDLVLRLDSYKLFADTFTQTAAD